MRAIAKVALIWLGGMIILGTAMNARAASESGAILGTVPPRYEHRHDTEHCVLLWRDAPSAAQIEQAANEVERRYGLVATYLGPARVPKLRIIVVFDGPMFEDGTRRIPHVDAQGRIFLYQPPDPAGFRGYFSSFAHELVHALRLGRRNGQGAWSPRFGFLEEGLAEAVALVTIGQIHRFPYWGTPPDVVSWYLLTSGKAIPLEQLLAEHRALNLRCEMQSYPQRGSFFAYLERTLGRDRFLAMAYGDGSRGVERFEKATGKRFAELAAAWRDAIMEGAAGIADIAQQAAAWRSRIDGYGMRVCEPGRDF